MKWTFAFSTFDIFCSDDRIGMDSQPKAVAAGKDGLVVVACINEASIYMEHRNFKLH